MSDEKEPIDPHLEVAAAVRLPDRAARLARLRELLLVVGPLLRPVVEALIERLLEEIGRDTPAES